VEHGPASRTDAIGRCCPPLLERGPTGLWREAPDPSEWRSHMSGPKNHPAPAESHCGAAAIGRKKIKSQGRSTAMHARMTL
jgi:hypothetical protein